MAKASKKKSIARRSASISQPPGHLALHIAGFALAFLIVLLVGKMIYSNLAINSRASGQDVCAQEKSRLAAIKRVLATFRRTGEDIDDETQNEYDNALNAYRVCMTAQAEAKKIPEGTPVTGNKCDSKTCNADEKCIMTQNATGNNNGGVECVPTRCLDANYKINPSKSYCDPQQNLFRCSEFLTTGSLDSFSCTANNMTCVDHGNGTAECAATTATTKDCRHTDATHPNYNSNCDASSFCNLQTGRCIHSSNTDGTTVDAEKAACTSSYQKQGCGPQGDGVQSCRRHWDASRNLCVNDSCGICQF